MSEAEPIQLSPRTMSAGRHGNATFAPSVTPSTVFFTRGELNAMLAFVEQLSEVNVDGVEPMTSVTPMEMKKRADVVTDDESVDNIVKNAPATQDHYFLVPKVVE